jgi:ABC transporter substrate binding protein
MISMRRRDFITLLGGAAAAWPLAAHAQAPKNIPRLCFLTFDPGTLQSNRFGAFFQGLRDLGYGNGQNIVIDYLSAEGNGERFPALAAECLRLKADVIVVSTTPAAQAAMAATRSIPIIMIGLGDPVRTGLVNSLDSKPAMISFTVKSLMLRLRKYASIASHPSTPSDSGSSTIRSMPRYRSRSASWTRRSCAGVSLRVPKAAVSKCNEARARLMLTRSLRRRARCHRPATTDSLHTDRFCARCRSGLCRLRHQPGTAGGQYHRTSTAWFRYLALVDRVHQGRQVRSPAIVSTEWSSGSIQFEPSSPILRIIPA